MSIQSSLQDMRSPEEDARELSLLFLLQRVWTYPLTTKSDLIRTHADEVAEAASRGLLTTLVVFGGNVYGRLWKITPEGLAYLSTNGPRIAKDEVENYGSSYCLPQEP